MGGLITDGTGAVIPDVRIVLTNADTGIPRETRSNPSGYYTLPLLQPGNYRIKAEKQGFRSKEQTGVVLQVDQQASINFTLDVGQLPQEVSVSAAPLLLNTVEPSVGTVIQNRQVEELPLNGRNYI